MSELEAKMKDRLREIETHLKHPKSYYKSTLIVTGLLFLLNGLFLYFGTVFGSDDRVSQFFGFKDGTHKHLQRTTGLFFILMSAVNFITLLGKKGSFTMLAFSLAGNGLIILHYFTEALYFGSLRPEVMFMMLMVLVINGAWAGKDYFLRVKMQRERASLQAQLQKDKKKE